MIVDVHTHVFPDDLADRAIATVSSLSGAVPFHQGTLASLESSMLEAGVGHSVVQHIATKPGQVGAINRFAASIQSEKVSCFGTVHPDCDAIEHELDHIVELSLSGVKLHPDFQGFYVDEPRMVKVYRMIQERSLPVLFHCGFEPSFPETVRCTPERLRRVLQEVPGLTVIAGHFGGNCMYDAVSEHLIGQDLYLETSFSLLSLKPDQLRAMIRAHGSQKVLFGTDSPWANQAQQVESLRNLGLTEGELASVLGGNARRLLPVLVGKG